MANTTNYNWETPDDTDLVKDGAAAIRTLGNSIDTTTKNLNPETTLGDISYRSSTANTNTRLPIGTSGQVLTVIGGVPAWSSETGDITEVQAGTGISVASGTGPIPVVTNTVATTFDAKGDLVAGTGADTFAKLTVGANNTVLTADSSTATGLKWAAPAGGKVLQVVQGTYDVQTSSTSTSYVDTNLTASITPSATSSKILVMISHQGVASGNASTGVSLKLFRGATELAKLAHYAAVTSGTESNVGTVGIQYLDSPNTTSSTTYKTQFANSSGTGTVYIQSNGGSANVMSTITLLEIGA
jgi:hypothetical protein